MTKTFLTLLIACCSSLYSFGQPAELILTEQQNEQWFDRLSKAPLSTQLQLISERLLADTNVFVKKSYPDGIRVQDSLGSRAYGVGSPMLLVENVYLGIDNHTDRKKIIKLAQMLHTDAIEAITLMKGTDPQTTALYGSKGWSGVIVMKLKSKKDVKRFRKLELHS